jgi:hypothetical protein
MLALCSIVFEAIDQCIAERALPIGACRPKRDHEWHSEMAPRNAININDSSFPAASQRGFAGKQFGSLC